MKWKRLYAMRSGIERINGSVKAASVPAGDTKLIYENGERTQEAGKYISGDADRSLGKFLAFEEQPKDPAALHDILRDEKHSRECFKSGNIKAHIEKLSGTGREKKRPCGHNWHRIKRP